jgi:hypothetical protein
MTYRHYQHKPAYPIKKYKSTHEDAESSPPPLPCPKVLKFFHEESALI